MENKRKNSVLLKIFNYLFNNNHKNEVIIFKSTVPRKVEFICSWPNCSNQTAMLPTGLSKYQRDFLKELSKYNTITKVTIEVLE